MQFKQLSFGSIRVDETTYEHDLILDRGQVHERNKKPSKRFRDEFGTRPCPSFSSVNLCRTPDTV